ncbi:MAG: uracil-DNA glycosylase family protein [Alphaproteobacteria bacterium]|nr:uracil-DNA glycosylase family protein [Alphaproteobacteria bacterium]
MSRELAALAAEIRACRLCAGKIPEPRPVLRPSATARICVAGQAPGTRVHASGIPFDDRSGDRLREWMGIDRDIFYDDRRIAILPMGFCFPGQDARGGDLPPRAECARTWRTRILSLMPQIEVILLLGSYAQRWHLKDRARASLTETVQGWRALAPGVVPLPHPSWRNNGWLRKNPWFERDLLPELRRRLASLL